MGLKIIIVLAIVVLYYLIIKFILKDLAKYFGAFFKLQVNLFTKKGNNLGQLLATITIAVFIGVLSFLLYKTLLILAAYLLSGNLIEFFTINRGVFSSYGTNLQNPYLIKNLLYGVIITPIMQLISIIFMIISLHYFMYTTNALFNQKIYKVSSLVFFGIFSSLTFLSLELISYVQSVTFITTTTLIILLIGAKLSYLLFYFGIIHITLSKNKNYLGALKNLKFNRLEGKLMDNPYLMVLIISFIAMVLNFPLYTGFQFGRNNWVVFIKLVLAGAIFVFLLKKVFAKGFNYIGVYMIDDNKNQDIIPFNFINKKTKKIILKCLIISILALLFLSFKSFLFFTFNGLVFASISAILLLLVYGGGTLFSILTKKINSELKLNWIIPSKLFLKFLILVIPTLLVMVITFTILTVSPQENTNLENYINYKKSIVDEKGNLLYFENDSLNPSIPIQYNKLPSFFLKALILKEDRNILNQNSLLPNRSNWHGISLTTIYSGSLFGSSNITQQLIKNLAFDRFPQELQRKFTELGASYQFSKNNKPEEIINHYVNAVSFNGGTGHTGIISGSYYTFGRSIENINELEMLYLLFTLHRGRHFKISDKEFIPYKEAHLYPEDIKEKLLKYAKPWYENGLITKKEFRKLKRQELIFTNKPFKLNNSAATNTFLANSIKNEIKVNVSFQSSITLKNQLKMNLAVNRFSNQFNSFMVKDGCNLYASALVVDIKTGNIIAHYGGNGVSDMSNFGEGNSIGSVIKPIVLLELSEKGYQIRLFDGKIQGRKTPRNANHPYSNHYVNLNYILKKSPNAPLRNIDEITPPIPLFIDIEEKFRQMNISADSSIDLSDTEKKLEHTINYPIGSRRMTIYEIAQCYQTIFNEGVFIKLSVINKSFNPYNLTEHSFEKDKTSIYNKQNVSIITNALKASLEKGGTAYGLNKYLPHNIQFMAKTGTTDRSKHGYTILSDGNTLVVSWVSYGKQNGSHLDFNNTPAIPYNLGGSSAGVLAAMIFQELYK